MTLTENLRKEIFWIQDKLNGGIIQNHLKDIRMILNEQNDLILKNELQNRLHYILNYAKENTEYYKHLNGLNNIEDFPVMDKNGIRNNLDSFLSKQYNDKQRIPVVTSGSTGTPFKTFQSRNKRKRNSADTIYFASLAGYELGNKLYYFKIWSTYNQKSNLKQKIQNIIPIDVLNLKANAKQVIKELNKNTSSISFLGYVSAFETICKELDNNNALSPKLKINSILTMSEGLNTYTKQAGEKHFGCPVLSRYSNIENGIIAQQTLEDRENFLVNTASYYVEVIDMESDTVLEYGKLGRIIVTDYFNEVMPLIRYDTGDLGVLDMRNISGRNRLVLTIIEGRKLDQIFNTKGELISSYIVYKNMWAYTEIEQYQFVQKEAKEYVFKISMNQPFKRETQLINEFKYYLGDDADFKVEYVSEIPLLNSGKRKKVVNEMHN